MSSHTKIWKCIICYFLCRTFFLFLFQTSHLWVTVNQVWPVGEWVWDTGKGNGRGEAGRAEVVHVGRAHHESNLTTRAGAQEHVPVILRLHCRVHRVTTWTLAITTVFYSQEASTNADVSMNFSGKLASVALLVLLAAQGKTLRAKSTVLPNTVGTYRLID